MNRSLLALLGHSVTPIWLLLVAATGLSWWMGGDGAGDADVGTVSTALIIVAFVKVRFVIRYFMEVRTAALPLKLVADAWVLIVCGAVLYLYWLSY